MEVPTLLYRGLKELDPELLTPEFFNQTLHPGSDRTNEAGERVVHDGNEYGVYMTDNEHMALPSYAMSRHGKVVPEVPAFTHRGYGEQLRYPTAGVLLAITTAKGLQVRKPKITPVLRDVYNNGFAGNEWIADEIAAEHYRPVALSLGGGTIGRDIHWAVEGDAPSALATFQERYAGWKARTDALGEAITALPEGKRRSGLAVGRLIQEHSFTM